MLNLSKYQLVARLMVSTPQKSPQKLRMSLNSCDERITFDNYQENMAESKPKQVPIIGPKRSLHYLLSQ